MFNIQGSMAYHILLSRMTPIYSAGVIVLHQLVHGGCIGGVALPSLGFR
jgi:hypothetical protein